MELLTGTLSASWAMLLEAAPYIWLGLIAAGLLHAWVPQSWIMAQLGGRGAGSVWKAALLGIPIPLCSCGVIPAAVGLRKRGAGRGATLSFLISTPETDIDSIALTWAMLGPVWAVIRPVAAIFVAVGTGLVANLLPDKQAGVVTADTCSCCNDVEGSVHRDSRPKRAFNFMFKELLPDIGWWLLLGLLLSGIIVALFPPDLLATLPGGPIVQMLCALVIGIPLYICAAASTPLVAALLLKGMAPGAALVLLLTGPATNLASALVISKQLGKAGTAIYLGGLALGSLLCGLVVQALAPAWKLGDIQLHEEFLPSWLANGLAILLLAVIILPWLHRTWRARSRPVELRKADTGQPQHHVHKG